jgi:hypothetical protein
MFAEEKGQGRMLVENERRSPRELSEDRRFPKTVDDAVITLNVVEETRPIL